MPTVRVFLDATTKTNRPNGLYDTCVSVSDEQYAKGDHIRIACRRAGILGYAGPYRVCGVRELAWAQGLTREPPQRQLPAAKGLKGSYERLLAQFDDEALRQAEPARAALRRSASRTNGVV